ncbi:epidermal growth factor receptor substrate 15 [Pelomyxa schiedti]|nr:epidermal growth factor receptor substrate 15 [Pelomyxa schiedti]
MTSFQVPLDVEGLFKFADADGDGILNTSDLTKLLMRSKLPQEVLARVWEILSKSGMNIQSREFFFAVLRMVAAVQQGRDISQPCYGLAPPQFEGYKPPLDPWAISPENTMKYGAIFDQSKDLQKTMSRSRFNQLVAFIPPADAGRIWDIADNDHDTALSRAEFIVGMHLASCRANMCDIPSALSPSILSFLQQSKQSMGTQSLFSGGASTMMSGLGLTSLPPSTSNSFAMSGINRGGAMTGSINLGTNVTSSPGVAIGSTTPTIPVTGTGFTTGGRSNLTQPTSPQLTATQPTMVQPVKPTVPVVAKRNYDLGDLRPPPTNAPLSLDPMPSLGQPLSSSSTFNQSPRLDPKSLFESSSVFDSLDNTPAIASSTVPIKPVSSVITVPSKPNTSNLASSGSLTASSGPLISQISVPVPSPSPSIVTTQQPASPMSQSGTVVTQLGSSFATVYTPQMTTTASGGLRQEILNTKECIKQVQDKGIDTQISIAAEQAEEAHLKKDLSDLQAKLAVFTEQFADSSRQFQVVKSANDAVRLEIENKKKTLMQMTKEMQEAKAAQKVEQDAIGELKEQLSTLSNQIAEQMRLRDQANDEMVIITTTKNGLQETIQQSHIALKASEAEVCEQIAKVDTARAEKVLLEQQSQACREELAKVQEEIRKLNESLTKEKKEIEQIQRENELKKKEAEKDRITLEKLKKDLSNVMGELERARNEAQKAKTTSSYVKAEMEKVSREIEVQISGKRDLEKEPEVGSVSGSVGAKVEEEKKSEKSADSSQSGSQKHHRHLHRTSATSETAASPANPAAVGVPERSKSGTLGNIRPRSTSLAERFASKLPVFAGKGPHHGAVPPVATGTSLPPPAAPIQRTKTPPVPGALPTQLLTPNQTSHHSSTSDSSQHMAHLTPPQSPNLFPQQMGLRAPLGSHQPSNTTISSGAQSFIPWPDPSLVFGPRFIMTYTTNPLNHEITAHTLGPYSLGFHIPPPTPTLTPGSAISPTNLLLKRNSASFTHTTPSSSPSTSTPPQSPQPFINDETFNPFGTPSTPTNTRASEVPPSNPAKVDDLFGTSFAFPPARNSEEQSFPAHTDQFGFSSSDSLFGNSSFTSESSTLGNSQVLNTSLDLTQSGAEEKKEDTTPKPTENLFSSSIDFGAFPVSFDAPTTTTSTTEPDKKVTSQEEAVLAGDILPPPLEDMPPSPKSVESPVVQQTAPAINTQITQSADLPTQLTTAETLVDSQLDFQVPPPPQPTSETLSETPATTQSSASLFPSSSDNWISFSQPDIPSFTNPTLTSSTSGNLGNTTSFFSSSSDNFFDSTLTSPLPDAPQAPSDTGKFSSFNRAVSFPATSAFSPFNSSEFNPFGTDSDNTENRPKETPESSSPLPTYTSSNNETEDKKHRTHHNYKHRSEAFGNKSYSFTSTGSSSSPTSATPTSLGTSGLAQGGTPDTPPPSSSPPPGHHHIHHRHHSSTSKKQQS